MNQEKRTETGATKRHVVIVAMTGRMLLDFSGPVDVFNSANAVLEAAGKDASYIVRVVAPTADRVVTNEVGLDITCSQTVFDISDSIDTLLIAGTHGAQNLDDPRYSSFYSWLIAKEQEMRRIGSICAGAFSLAKAGLLDGKRATTHWDRSELLSRNFPKILVDSNPFHVSDGKIYTSGGVSSGIDLALALVEEDLGRDIALQVARRLVFYLNRPGFQQQFGNLLPIHETHELAAKLRPWLIKHIGEPLDVATMAEHVHMSQRNFTRVFHRQTGLPPARYLEKLRVEAARRHLEDGAMSLEQVAAACGLGGLVSMRRVFLRHFMVTPSDYRRAFRTSLTGLIAENTF
ncbi:GlxA family transcriptional regulator [Pedobacter sp. SYP-B3415]|uniref:GlxA family transcriptional regulator n=1 Tax=Pedobacter sp. SYP-B3415 TaxID=2496641 RepID=UPI00101C4A6D|nr:helix-turn-helix domain-containing protein [Pedobacter sp. SYP-B3415]